MSQVVPPTRPSSIIPNALSVLRALLAMAFPFVEAKYWLWIIVAAAASDALDGFLARALHAASWIGGILDASADKLFVAVVTVTFIFQDRVTTWEAFMLLQRDLIVLLVVGQLALLRHWVGLRQMPARPLGKVTTAVLLLCFAMLCFRRIPDRTHFDILIIYIAATLSVAAGLDYSNLFERAAHRENRREDDKRAEEG
jgi:cardiolipin synthase